MRKKLDEIPRRWVDRRRAPRSVAFDEVSWRGHCEARHHRALLVGISRTGLALVTARQDTPPCGDTILPVKAPKRRNWTQFTHVRRVEPLSESCDLVAAEYLTPSATGFTGQIEVVTA